MESDLWMGSRIEFVQVIAVDKVEQSDPVLAFDASGIPLRLHWNEAFGRNDGVPAPRIRRFRSANGCPRGSSGVQKSGAKKVRTGTVRTFFII